jgi:hypothetical protein
MSDYLSSHPNDIVEVERREFAIVPTAEMREVDRRLALFGAATSTTRAWCRPYSFVAGKLAAPDAVVFVR